VSLRLFKNDAMPDLVTANIARHREEQAKLLVEINVK
jgi:hypothetical protein